MSLRCSIINTTEDNKMLQVRVDDETKNKASEIFNALGIDLSTAVRIFLLKCIAVGGLPFEMNINNSTVKALAALERMGQKSKELGNDQLTLDEINEIIAEFRDNPNQDTIDALKELETMKKAKNKSNCSYDELFNNIK